ncbi:MAG: universal stress protein [Bacteroidales bacterium]|jgi:nucleotide-binding universal stress UspA family protein|nr:universal stress protein [Bacteroidales bacterium]
MEENKKLIVVPWDFTQVAENALEHAVKISKMVDNDVCLLHIIDPGLATKEAGIRKAKLKQAAEAGNAKYNMPVHFHIEKGSIFSSIAEYANEKDNNVSLVIMGTHGIKGMQKLTGSWALKVIVKSKVPFIVIQDAPGNHEKYRNIVFPVDFRSENKEKMKMAIFMGKYFDSKIHMLVAVSTDKSLLKKTHANLNYAIKYLIQNNIEYQIHEVPKKKFAQQTVEFSQQINADVILIMTTKNITMADYMLGASEQYIIANSSKIPVCCVNPKASFAKVGQFMYG